MTGRPEYRKKHFWQKIRPVSFVVEKEEMTVVTFLIPGLQKGWRREKLFQLMQESAEEHPLRAGGVRILIQPQVRYLLAEPEEKNRDTSSKAEIYRQPAWTETFLAVCFPLSERILRERFPLQGRKAGMTGPESVVILMGTLFFPEEQMQHFAEMIAPYLPCINALTIFYEAGDAGENCGGAAKRQMRESKRKQERNRAEIRESGRRQKREERSEPGRKRKQPERPASEQKRKQSELPASERKRNRPWSPVQDIWNRRFMRMRKNCITSMVWSARSFAVRKRRPFVLSVRSDKFRFCFWTMDMPERCRTVC